MYFPLEQLRVNILYQFLFLEVLGGLCWRIYYNDVIMVTIASQITSLAIVYSTVYSGRNQRKHQSSVSLAFVRGIHWWPMNSPHKGPVTRKMFFHLITSLCSIKSQPHQYRYFHYLDKSKCDYGLKGIYFRLWWYLMNYVMLLKHRSMVSCQKGPLCHA